MNTSPLAPMVMRRVLLVPNHMLVLSEFHSSAPPVA
jgi:hypothetical protein